MYGKYFQSTFTGSMFGAGAHVFALWGYVIANTHKGIIELNPVLVAAVIGCKPEDIKTALDYLCNDDPHSRSKNENGRRLIREGQFQYRVVNFADYHGLRSEDERREYNRIRKQVSRARQAEAAKRSVTKNPTGVTRQVIDLSKNVNNTDTDTDTDTDKEKERDKEKEVSSAEASKPSSPSLRVKSFVKEKPTEEEVKHFCVSIGLPASDGEAMFLHWEEKKWPKSWQLTIRKWKSFGYLPSQKIRPALLQKQEAKTKLDREYDEAMARIAAEKAAEAKK